MNSFQPVLEQVSEAISAVLPRELTDDVRKNVKAAVRAALADLDLVTREELEVQEAVLKRTREKVDQLERQVRELESSVLTKE